MLEVPRVEDMADDWQEVWRKNNVSSLEAASDISEIEVLNITASDVCGVLEIWFLLNLYAYRQINLGGVIG